MKQEAAVVAAKQPSSPVAGGILQRRAVTQNGPDIAPSIVHEVLRSSGRPLDPATRAYMEPRFGHDFSQVRMHTDAWAAESARAMNALAYTVGRDVVFAAEQYAPGTTEGKELLAHELAHVLQQQGIAAQGGAVQMGMRTDPATETLCEREAHRAAQDIAFSILIPVEGQMSAPTLQKAAPAAAVIGAYAVRCIVSAIIGVLFDLGIQGLMYGIRQRTWRVWQMTVDICSLVLSAVLGCLGGMVALRWLEPWLDAALGTRLGGVAGTLLGRILIWIANNAGIGIPRWVVKSLLKFGCVSEEQAELITPGVSREGDVTSEAETTGAPGTSVT